MNLKEIIELMGYDCSDNYFYFDEIEKSLLSCHDKKVLNILKPFSFYAPQNKPLIVFFNDLKNRNNIIDFNNKLWNSQIPIIISDEGDNLKIYSSKDMDFKDNELKFNLVNRISKESIIKNGAIDCFSYWDVTDERFLQKYNHQLTKKTINDYLIDNLKYLTSCLKNIFKIPFAHKLILRILFTRYLIDRGVDIGYKDFSNDIEYNKEYFLSIVQCYGELYGLFEYLKQKFNGNLFEIGDIERKSIVPQDALNYIADFLSAKVNMDSGQISLFPYYDFDIIPIELISNVYEVLLGINKQKEDKAFYTPEYLVDYILEDTVKCYLNTHMNCKVIDPACGSGIFLVKVLKLILEKNADPDGFINNNMIINDIVTNNIFGIDYNDEAIDVTIFSLYITIFDFKNPKLLSDFKFPNIKNHNLISNDFFDTSIEKLFKNVEFNFVIGNPPWGKISNQSLYVEYVKNNGMILPNKEICIAFMIKLHNICSEHTQVNLIIPSKILYNEKKPSRVFREMLLKETVIRKVTELSSVRKLLFKDAIAPAAIISFNKSSQESLNNKFKYISLKPNKVLNYYNLIVIEPGDVKYLRQDFLVNNDWAWKTVLYGTYHDFKNVKNLMTKYLTLTDIEKKEGLIFSKGIQAHEGAGKSASHLIGKKFLNSRDTIDHFQLDQNNYTLFDMPVIHRPRDPELFIPPYVLFTKGLDSSYSIRASFSNEEFVYNEAINCIKGNEGQENILKNILGLLNSSLYSYLNVLLGTSVGIEREQIFLSDLKKYPYLYSEELVNKVDNILNLFNKNECSEELKKKQINEINNIVFKMFDIENAPSIDYILNYQIPRLKGSVSIYNPASEELLEKYENAFVKSWNSYVESENVCINTKFYRNILNKFDVFNINFNNSKEKYIDLNQEILELLMYSKINDMFYQEKNIIEFREDDIYIIKKSYEKNWHYSLANKDCNDILNSILFDEEI